MGVGNTPLGAILKGCPEAEHSVRAYGRDHKNSAQGRGVSGDDEGGGGGSGGSCVFMDVPVGVVCVGSMCRLQNLSAPAQFSPASSSAIWSKNFSQAVSPVIKWE